MEKYDNSLLIEMEKLIVENKIQEAKTTLLKICASSQNPYAYLSLGSVFALERSWLEAKKYYEKSKKTFQETDEPDKTEKIAHIEEMLRYLAADILNAGIVAKNKKDFLNSEILLNTAKEMNVVIAAFHLSLLKKEQGEYQQARNYCKESLDLGLRLYADENKDARKYGIDILVKTHFHLALLDIYGYGCEGGKANPVRAMQNFKSAHHFQPNNADVIGHISRLNQSINKEAKNHFDKMTQPIEQKNGRITFGDFIFEYTNTPNLMAYMEENKKNMDEAFDDILSHYLAGTDHKILLINLTPPLFFPSSKNN